MEIIKAIVTAMQEEADLIIERFELKKIKEFQNIRVYEGKRNEDTIILVNSGIGKVQASIATSYLFENYDIFKLINIGIAGNLQDNDTKVGDVFLPNTFLQHDIYLPFDGTHLDYAKKGIFLHYAVGENYDLYSFGLILSGICVTGDQFIDNDEKIKDLRENFSADICDMEAFAVLSVAREYNKLDVCVVIKAISDGANSDAKEAHMNNLDFAMKNSIDVLELVL